MSADNINDIYEYIADKFKKLLNEDISDYELSMIKDAVELPSRDISTSKAILSDRINEAVKIKSNLNYLSFRLSDKRKMISLNYTPKYNKLFTVLTRQGRPSKAAIDSEIMYLNNDMYSDKLKMDEFDELLQFISDQNSIIDMVIRNMESRRYDL